MRTLLPFETWWMIALFVGLYSFPSPKNYDRKFNSQLDIDNKVVETWYEDENGKPHGIVTAYDFVSGKPVHYKLYNHGLQKHSFPVDDARTSQ